MSEQNKNGGPAFPTVDANRPEDYGTHGMSLRDYAVIKFMAALCANPAIYEGMNYGAVAYEANCLADAMLAARQETSND